MVTMTVSHLSPQRLLLFTALLTGLFTTLTTASSSFPSLLAPRDEDPLAGEPPPWWECRRTGDRTFYCEWKGTWRGNDVTWDNCDVDVGPPMSRVCRIATICLELRPGYTACVTRPPCQDFEIVTYCGFVMRYNATAVRALVAASKAELPLAESLRAAAVDGEVSPSAEHMQYTARFRDGATLSSTKTAPLAAPNRVAAAVAPQDTCRVYCGGGHRRRFAADPGWTGGNGAAAQGRGGRGQSLSLAAVMGKYPAVVFVPDDADVREVRATLGSLAVMGTGAETGVDDAAVAAAEEQGAGEHVQAMLDTAQSWGTFEQVMDAGRS